MTAIWAYIKRSSGVFDADGRFSWAGVFALAFRLIKARTVAFLRGAVTGLVSHFLLVALQEGFKDVRFPLTLVIPVFDVLRPSGPGAAMFSFATTVWGIASTVISFALARRRAAARASAASWLPWIAGAGAMLLGSGDAWADDGGWSEWSRGQNFWRSGGAALLGESCIVGGVTGLGAALGEAAADSGEGGGEPPLRRRPAGPTLIDPDSDEPLTVNDGSWPDAPVGHVWYGEWVSPETAAEWIRQRREELRKRQAEIDAFNRETESQSEARRAARAEQMAREGYVYDPETDTWVLDRTARHPDGRDAQGFDEHGYDRDGYDREGFNREGFDRNGWGRNGFNRDGVNADGERIEDVRARLQARQEEREDYSSGWTPWLSGYAEGWAEGVKRDVMALPEVAADAAAAVADGTMALLREARDPENWRVVKETFTGTAHDIFVDPAAGARKAWQSSKDAGGAAAQLAKAVVENPIQVAKALVGLDNWEKAMDPNVPLKERIAAALMGSLDIGLTLAGGSAAKGARAADDLTDAARAAAAADDVSDASRAARAADAADAGVDTSRAARAKKPLPTAEEANEAARRYKQTEEYQRYKDDVERARGKRLGTPPEGGPLPPPDRGVGDYVRIPGQRPDTRGMPTRNVKHAQVVADRYGVTIQVRPTNPDARALLESGQALPKPMKIKAKTVNDLDVALGMPADAKGKVAVFRPTDPPGSGIIGGEIRDRAAFDTWKRANPELAGRWQQRAKEFGDELHDMEALAKKGDIVWDANNPVILDRKTGLPFTGDHDVFDIRGVNGERVSPAVRAQVIDDLSAPPYRNQHGAHMDWRPTADAAHAEKNLGIDRKILNAHRPASLEGGGEALITVTAGREMSASYFEGWRT